MRQILMIAANPATSPVTGWPIGFWYAELSHAWLAFRDAGYAVTIASPDGGDLQPDGWSDPEHESGYAAHDIVSLGFKRSPQTSALLRNTPAIRDLDPAAYDAIFLVGGQSPMLTFHDNDALYDVLRRGWSAGRILAPVCHATAVLLTLTDADGELIVKGRTWTGFANSEEDYADHAAGQTIQPFRIEDEGRKIEGTNFITGGHLVPFAIRDGNLVTGQQQVSSAAAANLVIQALGR